MIFQVTMKTPDALERAIKEALDLQDQVEVETEQSCDPDDPAYNEFGEEQILYLCKKWFRYNETITLEIDTLEKTCNVVQLK